MNNDVCFGFCLVTCNRNVTQNRQLCQLNHIVSALNLVVEELGNDDDKGRNGEADNERNEINHGIIRADFASEFRLINEFSFVSCSCKRNGIFFSLL